VTQQTDRSRLSAHDGSRKRWCISKGAKLFQDILKTCLLPEAGHFISNCMSIKPWRDVSLTALMRRMRRPRMQISYAEFAGRQAAGSRNDYPCRVDLAFSVRKWYRRGVALKVSNAVCITRQVTASVWQHAASFAHIKTCHSKQWYRRSPMPNTGMGLLTSKPGVRLHRLFQNSCAIG
jgi:hypothetical protein